ncbi:MAG: hypothetical protein IAE92_10845 [Burkholderiaceae bacterium]|nr:hypothetical protein [Burkholderiaceae bacterium]
MTRNSNIKFAAALTLSCVVGAAFADGTPMAPDEIKKSWVDKKVFARSISGVLVDFYLKSDGSAELSTGNFSDSGTWKLSRDGYCTIWRKVRSGSEACFTVVKDGSNVVVLNADKSKNSEILKVTD